MAALYENCNCAFCSRTPDNDWREILRICDGYGARGVEYKDVIPQIKQQFLAFPWLNNECACFAIFDYFWQQGYITGF